MTQLEERAQRLAEENHRLEAANLALRRTIERMQREHRQLRTELAELQLARARWQDEANRLMDQLWDTAP